MPNPTISLVFAALLLTGCEGAPEASNASDDLKPIAEKPELGLMTSLPLYWPVNAGLEDIASGNGEPPWQRAYLERDHELVLLDTLSPIPALSPDDPDTDPLAGLEKLAVIQPRGLSPADNVALDEWVRAGGQLLLVLDPLLTGHYEVSLGDPRRPTDAALIPPVVARWGMAISFDPEQSEETTAVQYPGGVLARSFSGTITLESDVSPECEIMAEGMLARCPVGEGTVTLLADAAIFEIAPREPLPEERVAPPPLSAFLRFAFP